MNMTEQQLSQLITEAVAKALTAHSCVVGFSPEDRNKINSIKSMLDEYSTVDLRENHEFVLWLRRQRNRAGNLLVSFIVGVLLLWAGSKMFPDLSKYMR